MKAKKLILSLIGGAILMAAYLAYFHASNQSYLSSFIVYICLFLIAGQGWNLLGGYIGEVSFGHAVFFGIGAYAVALPGGYNIDLPLHFGDSWCYYCWFVCMDNFLSTFTNQRLVIFDWNVWTRCNIFKCF